MGKIYDTIIIGSGPAGLTAAIYAKRARLDATVIEKEISSGGQVLSTYEIDNYPGLPAVNGYDLGMKFRDHADKLGTEFVSDQVVRVEKAEGFFSVEGEEGSYKAKSIIIATGARHKKLHIPGEQELAGRGVSYCATCDGAFFRNRITAVAGGGDTAIEDAIFLSRICEKVYLIHRRNELRGAKALQAQLFSLENVSVLWDAVVARINGKDKVESITIKNVKTDHTDDLPIAGLFVAVGMNPESDAFAGLVEMESGYIKAGEDCGTSVPGIFAAGDVRTKQLRQISTAVADGANAVASVQRYLAAHS